MIQTKGEVTKIVQKHRLVVAAIVLNSLADNFLLIDVYFFKLENLLNIDKECFIRKQASWLVWPFEKELTFAGITIIKKGFWIHLICLAFLAFLVLSSKNIIKIPTFLDYLRKFRINDAHIFFTKQRFLLFGKALYNLFIKRHSFFFLLLKLVLINFGQLNIIYGLPGA